MALFRKFFYRKPPDGLLEISERVYVFDCCFTTDVLEDDEYKIYMGGIVSHLRDHFLDSSFMVFNFREGENPSLLAEILSEFDMIVMDYPRHYEGCPLLTMEMIHHFLRSSESWLSLSHQNILLMHCERGGWPVLAFMLAGLLIYRKQYTGEQKTLDMIYKQAPRELLQLLSPLNPLPSQLRYLQYISRRNFGSMWPPLDRALTLDCVILRFIPNFDGEGGCRPLFRIYGLDPFIAADRTPKVLFSTPKRSKVVRLYKQADCELVKIVIHCHIQGDVVLECISLDDDHEHEIMMFRVMFNTAFIRSNILMLNRDEIDILWDAKDRFSRDFRAEILLSEMDSAGSIITVELPPNEEKGLPIEAFAKVQEIFNDMDWLDPKGDAALHVLHQTTSFNVSEEKQDIISPQKAITDIMPQKSSPDMQNEKWQTNEPVVILDKPWPSITTPDFVSPLKDSIDTRLKSQSTQIQDMQSELHEHLSQPKTISPCVHLSRSSPVSSSNSLQSSPTHLSRYHSAPSALDTLGITALLHDHASFGRSEVAHSTSISPSGLSLMPGVISGMPKHADFKTAQSLPSTVLRAPLPTPPPPPSFTSSSISAPLHSSGLAPSTSLLLSFTSSPSRPQSISSTLPPPPPPPPTPPSPPPFVSFSRILPSPTLLSEEKQGFQETEMSDLSNYNASLPVMGKASSAIKSKPSSPVKTKASSPIKGKAPSLVKVQLSAASILPPPPPTSNILASFSSISPSPHTSPAPPPCFPPLQHQSVVPSPPPPPTFSPSTSYTPTSIFNNACMPPPPPLPSTSVHRPPLSPPPPTFSPSTSYPPASIVKNACAPPPTSMSLTSVCRPSAPPPPHPSSKSSSISNTPPVPPAPVPPKGLRSPFRPPPPPNGISAAAPGSITGRNLAHTTSNRCMPSLMKRTSLKPLHWVKVTRAMQGSLWAETQKSDEASKAPEFDMSELESLFAAAVPNSERASGDNSSGRSTLGQKSDRIHLIDLRRANNCEIMLTKVKIPLNDLLNSVLALDDSVLDVDQVDNLIKFCPTKEEINLLKNFNGDKESLGKCEQYFLELMNVPRVESKLRVFSFKIQFRSQVADLSGNLNIVNSVAKEIRSSVRLKRIMLTILSLGNALNQGTARGSAVGFRLDSLLKLTDTRARNNKMTLMHYLCKVLAEKLPELLDFSKDLISLEVASKIQLKILAEEMQAISKGLEKVEQELTASENDGPISETFCKTLKEFLIGAEAEVRALTSLYSNVGRNADALALYFGEDPARCPFEQVVGTLLNFVRMFARAHKENCKQLELEKKKQQKEAENEKMKLNASKKEGELTHSPSKSPRTR